MSQYNHLGKVVLIPVKKYCHMIPFYDLCAPFSDRAYEYKIHQLVHLYYAVPYLG